MKGYCVVCFEVIDETEQLRGVCNECREKYPVDIFHDGIITTRRVRNARQER